MKLFNYLFIFIIIQSACVKEFTSQINQTNTPVLVIDAFINDVPLPKNFDYYNIPLLTSNTEFVFWNNSDYYRNPAFYFYLSEPKYNYYETVWEFFNSCVKLRLSNNLYANGNDPNILITNAKVVLKDDMGNIDTMRECSDPLFIKTTNRFSKKGEFRLQHLQPSAGHTYFLEVYYNGQKFTAQSFMPIKATVDSIEVNSIQTKNTESSFNKKPGLQPIIHIKPSISNAKNFYLFKKPDGLNNLNGDVSLFNLTLNAMNCNVLQDNTPNAKKVDGYQTFIKGNQSVFNYIWPSYFTNIITDSINSKYYYYGESNLNKLEYSPIFGFLINFLYIYNNTKFRNYQSFYKFKDNKINLDDLMISNVFTYFTYPIYFGSIDEKAYNYFNQLKTLFLNDGGAYTPTPTTPASNIQGGAIGYFYTSSGFVTEIPIINNSIGEENNYIGTGNIFGKIGTVFEDGSILIPTKTVGIGNEFIVVAPKDFKYPAHLYIPPIKPLK